MTFSENTDSNSEDKSPLGQGDAFDLSGFAPNSDSGSLSVPPKPAARRPESSRRDGPPPRYPDRGREKPRSSFSSEDRPRGEYPRKESGRSAPYPRKDFAHKSDRRYGTARPVSRDIENPIDPEVSKFLPLKHEKGRYRESRFLIEGAKNIADAVAISTNVIYCVLVAKGFSDPKLMDVFKQNRIRVQEVAQRDLTALCDTESPQGIVAVANFAALRPDWNTARTVTLLDGVQDPGNVGSILRTSAALGMDAVILGKGTCDAYNSKVVRSSAASLLRLPLENGEDLAAKIHFLRTKGFSVVATSPHAKLTISQAKLRRKVALLFGNEGAGVGENLLDQADATVRIPMRGKVESLNVAVAHGLLSYELMRVRGDFDKTIS